MQSPSVATMMITRKCLYRCPYCLIRRDKSIDLPPEFWIKVGKMLHDKWGIHVNMYGGEPLCYNGLEKIISEYTKCGISYSINSSSNPLTEERAKNLVSLGLRNWTVSVDSLHDMRSLTGIKYLELFRKLGVPDLMIECISYPGLSKNTLDVVEYAINNRFWISVSFQSFGMSKAYDSFPPGYPIWTADDRNRISAIAEILKNYDLDNTTKSYLNLWDDDSLLYQKVKKCNGSMISFNPDNDGNMRLCRDIKGRRVRKWNAIDSILNYNLFLKDWKKDFNAICKCCNWACLWFASEKKEELKHEL